MSQEEILGLYIEIDTLEAKLAKKREKNQADVTLDDGLLYSKRGTLTGILGVRP